MKGILRRQALAMATTSGVGLLAFGCGERGAARAPDRERGEHAEEDEVSPAEDLMREHGVLNRVLLVYDECIRRIDLGTPAIPADALGAAVGIIVRFVEEYHERLEEEFLFPRFEKAGVLVPLVKTLREQHDAGRRVTAEIRRLSASRALEDPEERKKLAMAMRSFVWMYRPHEAREDTVLFPTLRRVASEKELDALGEDFEKREHALFGKAGFEGVVAEVARIEEAFGLADLAKFTPA